MTTPTWFWISVDRSKSSMVRNVVTAQNNPVYALVQRPDEEGVMCLLSGHGEDPNE